MEQVGQKDEPKQETEEERRARVASGEQPESHGFFVGFPSFGMSNSMMR